MAIDAVDHGDLTSFLRADLTAFADPGAILEITDLEDGWTAAAWQHNGRRRTQEFLLRGDASLRDVRVRERSGAGEMAYATFLADGRMGDLQGLARNVLNVVEDVTAYVAPRATEPINRYEERADELVPRLAESPADETAVVFVTAEAGVGKTTLLKHLVRAKADSYLHGEEAVLWLYVNAQGSRLARLDQALAETLDDVRARFTYHAATALVRSGALVLVIDGFDELIGTRGTYDEAFSSLASFIEGLRGAGAMVAAARSAYYEQEFATRADTTIGFRTDRWALCPVALSDWNAAERHEFLSRYSEERGQPELANRVEAIFSDASLADLAGKPLFVSRVAALLAEGTELVADGESLVQRLITTYIRREANERLLSPLGMPLLTVAQMIELFTEIANEMWRQETRELSRTSLRELIDILTDLQGLDDEVRLTVVERVPYAALMRTGSVTGSVAFEHELYFSYFLAQPIIGAVKSDEPLTIARALRKARLPAQAGYLAGRGLSTNSDLQQVLDLFKVASTAMSTGHEQIRENAGLILSGAFSDGAATDLRIEGVDFVDCNLGTVRLNRVSLLGCSFRGTDLRGARFEGCKASGVLMDGVIVDGTTHLDIEGLPVENFVGLVSVSDGARTTLYAPDELQPMLASLSLPSAPAEPQVLTIDPDALDLVKRFARLYETTNLTTAEDENVMRRLVQNRYWDDVLGALLETGLLTEERRSASGNKTFMRMHVRPRDLLAGQSPRASADQQVRRFWDSLLERAPAS